MANNALQVLAQQELARRQTQEQPQVSGAQAGLRGFSSSMANNLLSPFNYVANTAKDDVKGLATSLNPFRELPDPMGDATYPQRSQQPMFGANQIMGGAQRLGEVAGAMSTGDYTQFQSGNSAQNQAAINQTASQEQPGMFTLGETGGDVATLLAGRTPFASSRVQMQQSIQGLMSNAAKKPGLPGVLNQAANKLVKTNFPRGLARAGEAGLEGAMLSVMDGNDPYAVAAMSAGSQAVGSMAIAGAKHMSSNLTGALVLGAVAMNYLSMLPGGDSGIIDALQTSANKVIPAMAVGVLAGVAGYGRTPAWLQEKVPEIADAISTVPRGAITSLIQEAFDEREKGQNSISLVLNRFSRDPDFFGQTAARRIQNAINSEDVSMSEVIDSLMDNKEFSEKFNSLGE